MIQSGHIQGYVKCTCMETIHLQIGVLHPTMWLSHSIDWSHSHPSLSFSTHNIQPIFAPKWAVDIASSWLIFTILISYNYMIITSWAPKNTTIKRLWLPLALALAMALCTARIRADSTACRCSWSSAACKARPSLQGDESKQSARTVCKSLCNTLYVTTIYLIYIYIYVHIYYVKYTNVNLFKQNRNQIF